MMRPPPRCRCATEAAARGTSLSTSRSERTALWCAAAAHRVRIPGAGYTPFSRSSVSDRTPATPSRRPRLSASTSTYLPAPPWTVTNRCFGSGLRGHADGRGRCSAAARETQRRSVARWGQTVAADKRGTDCHHRTTAADRSCDLRRELAFANHHLYAHSPVIFGQSLGINNEAAIFIAGAVTGAAILLGLGPPSWW